MKKLTAASKNVLVLDTFSLIAFFYKETSAEIIKRLFRNADRKKIILFFNEINLGELYYRVWKDRNQEYADASLAEIKKLPISLVAVDREFILSAAVWKAKYRISYADAFVVETAARNQALIVTGDPEFATVKEVKIRKLKK